MRRGSCPELVGRTDELAVLAGALDRARAGTGSTILVGGDAGIGKTRLVATFGDAARRAGCLVLSGGCAPITDGLLPYGPIGDVFREAASQLGLSALRTRLGPFAAVLVLVAPDLNADPVSPIAVHAPGQLLLGALRRLADRGPNVVVTEDLHWADPSTLAGLVLATRSLRTAAVIWIATYRTDELASRHRDVVVQLGRLGAIDLALGPLPPHDTAAQIAGIQSAEPSDDLVARISARSEGNPLFTEELLAADATSTELPANVRQLLLARVRNLPEPAGPVLAAAATAGRVVDHRLLARVTDVTGSDLVDVIRRAVDAHVLVADAASTCYTFRHALLHEAVLSTVLPAERANLHRLLAEALTDDPSLGAGTGASASAELAHHWRAAGELGTALAAHARAGDEAESVHAMSEAHAQFEKAIELWGLVPPRVRAHAGIGLAALYEHAAGTACLSGDTTRAVALLDEALARREIRDDALTAGLLYERLGHYLWVARADEKLVVAMYERAVDRVPAAPSLQRARALAGLGQILMLTGDYRRSASVCEDAVAISVAVGARGEEGHALNTLGVDLANLDRLDEGIAHLRSALAMAHETGSLEDLHRAHVNLAATLTSGPRLGEARAVAAEGVELTRRHGVLATQGAYTVSMLAEILYFEGRWNDAEELLARTTADPGFPVATVEIQRVAASVASARGRVDEAERLLASSAADGPAGGDRVARARLAVARAEHDLVHGRPSAALDGIAEAWGDLAVTDESHLLAQLAALGLAAVAAGHTVPEWLDQLDRVARQRCENKPVPPVAAAYLAQARAERTRLTCRSDAGSWNDAGDRWRALGRPYPAAWCRVREAEAQLGSRERKRAARTLDEAAQTAARLGADPLRRAVENLARRARLHVDSGAENGRGDYGLSPRELEVLALLADGYTNRDIAARLFISVRTAGVHVSRILTKLGVPNRGAAVAAARRLGVALPP